MQAISPRFDDRPSRREPVRQRWRPVLRLAGLCGLAGAWGIAVHLHRLVVAPPGQPVGPADVLLGLAVFVLLSLGLALTVEGPRLFDRVPRPPRPLLP